MVHKKKRCNRNNIHYAAAAAALMEYSEVKLKKTIRKS